MSLILCRKEQVAHPYYIDTLGIHIYSSQELCYVIYNHPLLVLDDFVDSPLIEFIRDELDMGYLAGKLDKWRRDGGSGDDMLIMILSECDYYGEKEIGRFRQNVVSIRKMHPADYAKTRADYMFRQGQYGKAIVRYEKVLELPRDQVVDDAFLGRVWNNLGAAYTRMFQFRKAYQALERSYHFGKSPQVLQRIYYLTVFCPGLQIRERYLSMFTPKLRGEWDEELSAAREDAKNSDALELLEELFQKDPIRRMEGACRMVGEWKQEYRSMV